MIKIEQRSPGPVQRGKRLTSLAQLLGFAGVYFFFLHQNDPQRSLLPTTLLPWGLSVAPLTYWPLWKHIPSSLELHPSLRMLPGVSVLANVSTQKSKPLAVICFSKIGRQDGTFLLSMASKRYLTTGRSAGGSGTKFPTFCFSPTCPLTLNGTSR